MSPLSFCKSSIGKLLAANPQLFKVRQLADRFQTGVRHLESSTSRMRSRLSPDEMRESLVGQVESPRNAQFFEAGHLTHVRKVYVGDLSPPICSVRTLFCVVSLCKASSAGPMFTQLASARPFLMST